MVKINNNLIIHADNIHLGGGASLLGDLILSKSGENIYFLLDERMVLDRIPVNRRFKTIKPKILSRLMAQLWLWRNLQPDNVLLCFGNLPPLLNVKSRVIVFIQNKYIISKITLNHFPISIRIRIFIERMWLKARCHIVDEFIVQTPSMYIDFSNYLRGVLPEYDINTKVRILPLMEDVSKRNHYLSLKENNFKQFDFIYPASGEGHKNHLKLIDAFIILAKEGHFPSLALTLDNKIFPSVISNIESSKHKFNLNIFNLGNVSRDELLKIYDRSSFLIYPSLFESFGIPLLEAKQLGLPIIASELDYVRDSINPIQSFDPNSSISIARAIKRSLSIYDESHSPLSPDDFVLKILKSSL